jgi:aminopeptidase
VWRDAIEAGTIAPMRTRLDPADVDRYARAIVFDALRLKRGDRLFIDCEPEHRELVAALGRVSFAEAIDVDVRYLEPLLLRARLMEAPDELIGVDTTWEQRRARASVGPDAGFLWICTEGEPGVLGDAPGDRLARHQQRRAKRFRWLSKASERLEQKWCIVDFPTDGWAKQAYPELDLDDAHRRLFADLRSFARCGPDDPDGAWAAHAEGLARLAEQLDTLDLRSIRYHGPGTDLTVGLVHGARWRAGAGESPYGDVVSVNMPTEEVFTSPDRRVADGTFTCTRPLSVYGRVMEGIHGTFARGRLRRIDCDREQDAAYLRELFAGRGGDRIGEVALVDGRSRIGAANRTYWSTLLDENAASHFAFGLGFPDAVLPGGDPAARRLVNKSDIHLDVMIGSPELDVTGTDARGRAVKVIRDGAFCFG